MTAPGIPSLEWGTYEGPNQVPHIIPMYGKQTMQPGHDVDIKCSCWPEVRQYTEARKVMVLHRIIH